MDPIAQWDAGVASLMASRGLSKAQATRELAVTNIAAYTAKHGESVRRPDR